MYMDVYEHNAENKSALAVTSPLPVTSSANRLAVISATLISVIERPSRASWQRAHAPFYPFPLRVMAQSAQTREEKRFYFRAIVRPRRSRNSCSSRHMWETRVKTMKHPVLSPFQIYLQ